MEKRLHVEFVFLKYDFTCFYINILDSAPERSRLAVRFLRNELGQGAVDVPFAVHLLFPFLITFGFNAPVQRISSKGILLSNSDRGGYLQEISSCGQRAVYLLCGVGGA